MMLHGQVNLDAGCERCAREMHRVGVEMFRKEDLRKLWLLHAMGALFVAACVMASVYFGAPSWLNWLVLFLSLYVAISVVSRISRRRVYK